MKELGSQHTANTEIVAMMTGSLFVMFKLLIGDIAGACFHMHNEAEIRDSWRRRLGKELLDGSLESNLSQLIEQQVYKSARLENSIAKMALQDHIQHDFANLGIAGTTLRGLFTEGLRLIQLHYITTWKNNNIRSENLRTQLTQYKRALSRWLYEFDALLFSKGGKMTEQERWESDNRRLMHQSIYIWLYAGISYQVSKPQPETLFDCFVSMGETMHLRWRGSRLARNGITLSLDTGAIPALNFISTKSESMQMRMRACSLLVEASGV